MFCNVLLQLIEYGKTETTSFSAVGPETEETNKLAKNQIRFDLKILKGDQGARI